MINNKVSNVPKLRFKEFSGEWDQDYLGNLTTFFKGKGISKDDIDLNGNLACIRYGELYTYYSEIINKPISKTSININDTFLSQKNDVIIPASGESAIDIARAACVLISGVALGSDLNILRSSLNGIFLSYYLNSAKKQEIARLAQGISIIHLYLTQLKLLNIFYPQQQEQQKIAEFLSNVDSKLQALKQKHQLLQQYKKGMMQKLFSQQIRFKDENEQDYFEWKEKKLSSIAEIVGGGTPDTSNSDYWNGEITWFTPTEIKSKYVSDSIRTISKLGLNKSSSKLLPKGSILFTSRATIGDVAIAKKECATNQGFQSLICSEKVNNEFLYYQLIYCKSKFLVLANGSTFIEISKTEVGKVSFAIPCIKEQQKIANFLSAIDQKIEGITKQIEQTALFKKGLLQQLFV